MYGWPRKYVRNLRLKSILFFAFFELFKQRSTYWINYINIMLKWDGMLYSYLSFFTCNTNRVTVFLMLVSDKFCQLNTEKEKRLHNSNQKSLDRLAGVLFLMQCHLVTMQTGTYSRNDRMLFDMKSLSATVSLS